MTTKTMATRFLPGCFAAVAVSFLFALGATCSRHAHAQPQPDPLTYSAPAPLPAPSALPAVLQVHDPNQDPSGFAQDAASAIAAKNWKLLAILLGIGAAFALRRWGQKIPGKVGKFLGSDAGGVASALLSSVLLTLATYVAAGKPLGLQACMDAFQLALGVMGGYAGTKKAAPALKALLLKPAPAAGPQDPLGPTNPPPPPV